MQHHHEMRGGGGMIKFSSCTKCEVRLLTPKFVLGLRLGVP